MALATGFGSATLFAGRNRQFAHHGQRQDRTQKESHNLPVRNRWLKSQIVFAVCLFLGACQGNRRPLLEDLSHREDFGLMRLANATGIRDGDKLAAQLLITDSSSILTMDLHFQVTPPTRLESGTWKFNRGGSGAVAARSVTFLGGQSGPPSLGGAFDLLDERGQLRYRVHLPTTELHK